MARWALINGRLEKLTMVEAIAAGVHAEPQTPMPANRIPTLDGVVMFETSQELAYLQISSNAPAFYGARLTTAKCTLTRQQAENLRDKLNEFIG